MVVIGHDVGGEKMAKDKDHCQSNLGSAIVKTRGDERSKNGGSDVKSRQNGCNQSGSSRRLQWGSHGRHHWPCC